MSGPLRVLVLESERGGADVTVETLTAAGHHVVRCHERGAPAFPCSALANEHCPVRDAVVDVALTVRSRPRSQPAPHEDGVSCALERHIPLVVSGATALNPFEEWATEVVDRDAGVVAACERAAAAPLPRHGERARVAIDDVLEIHGLDGVHASVVVHRAGGRLVATVCGAAHCEQAVKSMMSVRVVAKLRELDPDAAGIDVVFE